MSNNKNAIILVAIIAVLIILGGACFGFIWFSSSKNIMASAVNTTMDSIGEIIDEAKEEIKNSEEKTIAANMDIRLDLDLSDNILTTDDYKKQQDKLNDSNLKFDVKMNQKQKIMQMVLDLAVEGNDLLNLDVVIDDTTGYIKIKDVVDQYIKTDLTEDVFSIEEGVDIYEDIAIIYETVDPAIRKAILNGNIEKTEEEIDIDGEEVKVNKHTLTIDEKLADQIALATFEAIKDSEKAIDSIINISEAIEEDLDKDDFIEDLEDEIETIKENLEDEEYYEDSEDLYFFSIYTKGLMPKVIQYSLLDDINDGLVLKLKEKDQFELSFISSEEEMLKFEGVCKDDKFEISLKLEEDGQEIIGKLVYEVEEKNSKGSKEYIEITLDTGEDLLGTAKIMIDCETSITKDDIEVDTSDYIKEDEIPYDVESKLESKITEIMSELGISDYYFNSSYDLYDDLYDDSYDLYDNSYDIY